MSPPPTGGNRLFDPYAVYMGPPNTSAISPLTSKYVDPVAGIYLGPPEPPATRPANTAPGGVGGGGGGPAFMGGGGGPGPSGARGGGPPQSNIYRDPDFAEVEFNRGLKPQGMPGGQFGNMPPPPQPGFQPGFQPSSYPSGNRRL